MADSPIPSERERALEQSNRRLANENAEQKKRLEQQEREIQKLKLLLARAQRTSQNSSKRPSSDIVRPRQTKPVDGRKIGAQPGHSRHERPPFSGTEIHQILSYDLACCPVCQGKVAVAEGLLPNVLQQMEIVALPIEITEHRAHWYWCEACQQLHCPMPSPVEKGGLCGPELTAWIGYLKGGCHASFSTIRTFLRDVLGVSISRGMLAKVIAKVSASLETQWEELVQLLPLAKVLNIDETGHKENGQRMQTWVFRAREYIVFKIAETRGTAVLLESLGADFGGIIGCDYFSSYRCYMREFGGVLQFCLAHLIRDVKFLVALPDAATREYGERFLESLRQLFHIIHQREQLPATEFQRLLEAQRREILRSALTQVPASKEAQNLAERLRENGASYFRFISTPGIEPTNNLAEQAIRFVVIDRHITQGTRSEAGRHWCERIWTVIATCHQQGISAYHFIRDAVGAHFSGAKAPRLLAANS
jgi:transposase